MISDPLDSVQPGAEAWLNKDFLSIENPRAIAVQFPEATNSWKLTRATATNDWQLADARPDEKADSSKISSVTSPFSSPSFNDVAAAGTGSVTNPTVLTVETFDGFTYVAQIAPKMNETYPVSFSVSASLATQRPAATDEKAGDKAQLDQEFKTQQARLTDKLAREKSYERWIYQMPAASVEEFLKPRAQLLVEIKKDAATAPEK